MEVIKMYMVEVNLEAYEALRSSGRTASDLILAALTDPSVGINRNMRRMSDTRPYTHKQRANISVLMHDLINYKHIYTSNYLKKRRDGENNLNLPQGSLYKALKQIGVTCSYMPNVPSKLTPVVSAEADQFILDYFDSHDMVTISDIIVAMPQEMSFANIYSAFLKFGITSKLVVAADDTLSAILTMPDALI